MLVRVLDLNWTELDLSSEMIIRNKTAAEKAKSEREVCGCCWRVDGRRSAKAKPRPMASSSKASDAPRWPPEFQ